MFKEVSTKLHFPKIEEEILEFWQTKDIFQKSVKNRSLDTPFVCYTIGDSLTHGPSQTKAKSSFT